MGRRTTLAWGIALVTIGLFGMGAVWVLGLSRTSIAGDGAFASAGERISNTGLDAEGHVIPKRNPGGGMMGSVACVDCHGADGRGGTVSMIFGAVEIPDIRYSTLTTVRSEDGTSVPAWSESDVARAIREGVEPGGQRLKAPMPRWDMTDGELTDVIAYLRELDSR